MNDKDQKLYQLTIGGILSLLDQGLTVLLKLQSVVCVNLSLYLLSIGITSLWFINNALALSSVDL